MDIDLAEWHLTRELEPQHDHPGNPEEDDVESGYQHRSRIENFQLARVRRPAHGRERPQRRREPGVQYILILGEHDASSDAMALAYLVLAAPHVNGAVRAIPGWNPVAPPQLAADAPVLDVAHPLEIRAVPVGGDKSYTPFFDGANSRLHQRLHADVPLICQPGLDNRAAAIAARNHQAMRLDSCEQARRFEIGNHPLACLEAVEAVIACGRCIADGGIRSQDVDQRQAVALSDFVVVEIVGGRDLDATRAKGRVDIGIRNDRNFPTTERQRDALPDEMTKALILRMHCDRGVPQHRFRPRRRNREHAAAIGEWVGNVPETAVLLGGEHLEVGQRGLQYRIPVDQALAAINQALFMQSHEGLVHRPRHPGIHREAVTAPVHGSTEAPHLARDGAA